MGALHQALLGYKVAGGSVPTANLLFEYHSNSLTGADNDPITTWLDSSINARDAAQASAGNKPTTKTNIINGRPVARFDGGDWLIFSPDTGSMNAMTFFAVMKVSDSGNRTILGGSTNSAQVRITGQKIELLKAGVSTLGTSTTGFSTTSFFTIALTYDQAAGSNNLRFYLNGSADGAVSISTDLSGTGSDELGRRDSGGTGTERFLGDVAHIMAYNAVLSAGDLTAAHDYLRTLYAHY